jgi:predicted transcriptional regulator
MKLERRRSSIEIIADILRLGEAGKTEIMYSVNMSFFQLQKYLKYLLQLELIDKVTVGNPTITYRVTQKGVRLLHNIDNILKILEIADDDSIDDLLRLSSIEQREKELEHA